MVARIEERRAERRDDLLSDLVHARLDAEVAGAAAVAEVAAVATVDGGAGGGEIAAGAAGAAGQPEPGDGTGELLTIAELLNVIEQLLVAGNETTTKLITSGMVLLLEQPAEMAKVRADPGLIGNLVEEALRYESPVQMLFRTTTTDVEVAGVSIPTGAACVVVYGSANRDDGHFPAAADFDVERGNARTHLAFGQGPHFCVGAALARAEARIGFGVLLDRLDDLAVAPVNTYERELSMVLRGWKALHLTFAAQVAEKEGVPG
jgi:cytochrome P450